MDNEQFLIMGAFLLLAPGCAVNDTGLVNVRYFENNSSYLVIQEAWGGYLSTRQTDGGLTLGHAERIMVYPKPGNKSHLSINELLQQPNKHSFANEIKAKDIDFRDTQPYAWIENNQGIMLHVNSLKIGFSAGMESRSAIHLPSNFDGVFIFGSQTDGVLKAAIQETPQIQ